MTGHPRTSRPGTPALHVDGTQACAGADLGLFFPPAGVVGSRRIVQAKAVCARCPIEPDCLAYALTAVGVAGVPVDGVWGGTTRNERKHLRRELGLGLATGLVA